MLDDEADDVGDEISLLMQIVSAAAERFAAPCSEGSAPEVAWNRLVPGTGPAAGSHRTRFRCRFLLGAATGAAPGPHSSSGILAAAEPMPGPHPCPTPSAGHGPISNWPKLTTASGVFGLRQSNETQCNVAEAQAIGSKRTKWLK